MEEIKSIEPDSLIIDNNEVSLVDSGLINSNQIQPPEMTEEEKESEKQRIQLRYSDIARINAMNNKLENKKKHEDNLKLKRIRKQKLLKIQKKNIIPKKNKKR
jgi:aspartyl-tRNA synthetase